MSKGRIFKSGPPPHVGWWNASVNGDPDIWRWWDGKTWGLPCVSSMSGEHADKKAKRPAGIEGIKWSDYWPENARVPRIAP